MGLRHSDLHSALQLSKTSSGTEFHADKIFFYFFLFLANVPNSVIMGMLAPCAWPRFGMGFLMGVVSTGPKPVGKNPTEMNKRHVVH